MPTTTVPTDPDVFVFADVTFTEPFTAHGSRTGTAETYAAGDSMGPVQLHHTPAVSDLADPDAVWVTETDTDACSDFLFIPGRVVRVDVASVQHYRAE
jgi:hypothetical protein